MERQAALWESYEKSKDLGKLFDSLCEPGKETLDRSQVKQLLKQLDEKSDPTDEEVQFIMKVCEGLDDDPDSLSKGELQSAVEAWAAYQSQHEMLQKTLDDFDKSGNGKLEQDELKAFLTSLNGGQEVSEDEVEWVMYQADVFKDDAVSKPELIMATAAWYVHVEREEHAARKKEQQSKACSIL